MQSLPREGKRVIGLDILRTVTELLIALSGIVLVNIRDVVTEASLSIGQAMISSSINLKTEIETLHRQMTAEETSRTKSVAKQNPKYQACAKQIESSRKVNI